MELGIPLAILLIVLAAREQARTSSLRRELSALIVHERDLETDLFLPGAIPFQCDPELAWATQEDVPVTVLVFHILGAHAQRALRAARAEMRGHEIGVLYSPNHLAVLLWDTSENDARGAAHRLGTCLLANGAGVVNVGHSNFPSEGETMDELIHIADRAWLPLSEYVEQAKPRTAYERLTVMGRLGTTVHESWVRWLAGVTVIAALTFLIQCASLSFTWLKELPDAVRIVLVVVAAVVTAVSCTMAIAQSTERRRTWNVLWYPPTVALTLGLAAVGVINIFVGRPWATEYVPYVWSLLFAASIPVVISTTRRLLYVDGIVLVAVLAGSAVVVASTFAVFPLGANIARLAFASAAGALITRSLERISWILLVAILISGFDLYSVYSHHGVTRDILRGDSRVLDVVGIRAPEFAGHPLFQIGTTDAIFMAMFLYTAWVWRLGLGRTLIALCIAVNIPLIVEFVGSGTGIAVLPFLSVAFVLVHGPILLRSVIGGRAMRDAT